MCVYINIKSPRIMIYDSHVYMLLKNIKGIHNMLALVDEWLDLGFTFLLCILLWHSYKFDIPTKNMYVIWLGRYILQKSTFISSPKSYFVYIL